MNPIITPEDLRTAWLLGLAAGVLFGAAVFPLLRAIFYAILRKWRAAQERRVNLRRWHARQKFLH